MKGFVTLVIIPVSLVLGYLAISRFSQQTYVASELQSAQAVESTDVLNSESTEATSASSEPEFIVTHIKTPEPVKALYMTSWVASTPSMAKKVIDLVDTTEANALVIDIKDYTGKISFVSGDERLAKEEVEENRIKNIKQFIDELHKKKIYVIGRVAVFQDPHLVKMRPELAVKTASNKEVVWKDRKGISWLDAGSEEVWDYAVHIGKVSYDMGFDEINYDYIRFPSDGNMKDIYYPISEGNTKSEVLKSFFVYLNDTIRKEGIPISADLFGMVTTNTDDLNIGQVLENTLPYVDFVAPMVYPSHFPPTWNGLKNPAANPYDVIHYSMNKAVERAKAMGENPLKLRPWLQDFNLGATYTKEMVRDQIQATYDVGLTSWMIWDPANTYTPGGLLEE